jgi:hypothetical protein
VLSVLQFDIKALVIDGFWWRTTAYAAVQEIDCRYLFRGQTEVEHREVFLNPLTWTDLGTTEMPCSRCQRMTI